MTCDMKTWMVAGISLSDTWEGLLFGTVFPLLEMLAYCGLGHMSCQALFSLIFCFCLVWILMAFLLKSHLLQVFWSCYVITSTLMFNLLFRCYFVRHHEVKLLAAVLAIAVTHHDVSLIEMAFPALAIHLVNSCH